MNRPISMRFVHYPAKERNKKIDPASYKKSWVIALCDHEICGSHRRAKCVRTWRGQGIQL